MLVSDATVKHLHYCQDVTISEHQDSKFVSVEADDIQSFPCQSQQHQLIMDVC